MPSMPLAPISPTEQSEPGRGTVCFGLKGGIGSSSRLIEIGGATYTLGVLVQSNFGRMPDLAVCGEPSAGALPASSP